MNEGSLSNQQVNYRLEAILENATERNNVRIQEISKIPFCIIYGEVSKIIYDTFENELNMQLGSELAKVIVNIHNLQNAEDIIDTAFQNYRKNVEMGNTSILNNYMFSVIFMANQFHAEEMQQFMQMLKKKCRQKGIEGNYNITYYCVFDYENMDGINFKREIEVYFNDESNRYPMGITTQNNMYHTEFQKYWKGIQVIAMHIFLQCSYRDSKYFLVKQEESSLYFTLGYWKLDVLKQLLNDYFITALEKQNRNIENLDDYREMVIAAIDHVTDFDNNRWLDQFAKMPILYSSEVEEIFKVKWLGIKKTRINYKILLQMLYGKSDIFTRFLVNNLGDGAETEKVESFFAQQIGNLYFVKNQLFDVLNDIHRQYEREMEVCLQGCLINENIIIDKQSTIAEVIQMFCESVWNQESKVFSYTRKLNLIRSIQQYLQSSKFIKKLETIEKRNTEQYNQLKVLRREIAWNDKGVSFSEPIELCGEGLSKQLLWDANLLGDEMLKDIQFSIEDWHKNIHVWLRQNTNEVLITFLDKVETLKRNNKLELFYAARLNISYESKEKEYLYLNSQYQSLLDLSCKLPDLSIQSREWQKTSCMELFCIKEINDLAQIYNMS